MFQLRSLVLILPLSACTDGVSGSQESSQGDRDQAAPKEPEVTAAETLRHPDDPGDWVRIEQYEGAPIAVEREFHSDGGLRRIACYLPDKVGDPDGRHGPEWTFFKNGYKKEALLFRDGVPQGEFTRAWQNGQLRYQGQFVDGQRHGTYLQWWESGDLQMQFTYEHGVPNGTWREWYVGNAPKAEETYVDGLLQGERRTWDKPREDEAGDELEGVLTLLENYAAGKQHGPWQDYDTTAGTLRTRGNYEHGIPVGTWQVLWREGQVLDEYAYLDGQLHGLQRKFTPEGTPLEELTWEGGVKTGPARQFYVDGRVQAEGSFLDGLRDGPWRYYTPSGELNPTWSGVYENDDKVGGLPNGS